MFKLIQMTRILDERKHEQTVYKRKVVKLGLIHTRRHLKAMLVGSMQISEA